MLDEFKEEQPIVYKTIINSINKNKNSHAYLFETRGYSKALDFAKAFAKALICEKNHFNNKECSECYICKTIDDGNSIDVKIIEPLTNQIKKEQIEELKLDFSKTSMTGRKQIYIIDKAEKLNDKTQNSLLKFIEEPEDDIIAILIVENRYQLYETIVSRCQTLSFNNSIEVDGDKVTKIAKYLNNDREGIEKYIEEDKGKVDNIIRFIDYFEENGQINTHININKLLFQYDYDSEEVFKILILYYKDVLNYILKRKTHIFSSNIDNLDKISKKNTELQIIKKINILLKLIQYLKVNVNKKMIIDKLIIMLGGVK